MVRQQNNVHQIYQLFWNEKNKKECIKKGRKRVLVYEKSDTVVPLVCKIDYR